MDMETIITIIWIGYQELNEPYRMFYASSKYPDKTLDILGGSFTFTHLNMDADAYITTTVACEAWCKAWARELSEVKVTVGKPQACDYIEIDPMMFDVDPEEYEPYPINIKMPESLIGNTTNGLPQGRLGWCKSYGFAPRYTTIGYYEAKGEVYYTKNGGLQIIFEGPNQWYFSGLGDYPTDGKEIGLKETFKTYFTHPVEGEEEEAQDSPYEEIPRISWYSCSACGNLYMWFMGF